LSLFRAIAALAVLAAIIFGGPVNAHAHAGHVHAMAPSIMAPSMETASLLAPQNISHVTTAADAAELKSTFEVSSSTVSSSNISTSYNANVIGAHSHRSTECIPGACCCQGLSSCGMSGHCCPGALPLPHSWWTSKQSQAGFQLPAQGLINLDIIFGLDRPPKA
jgi:hypothetical protein